MLLKLLEYRWQLNIFSVYSIIISLINMKSILFYFYVSILYESYIFLFFMLPIYINTILFRKLAGCTNEVWNVSFCATRFLLSEVHWNGLHKETFHTSFVQPCGNIYKNIISISNPYCIKKAPSPMFF